MSKKTRLPFELVNDERGNILIPFALMSTIAIVSVGGAVDMGRAYQQRSKLQNVIDSAVISGLAKYQTSGDWSQATSEAAGLIEGYYSQAPVITNTTTANGVTTYTVETSTTTNGTTSLTTSTTTTAPTSSVNVPVVKFSNDGTTMTGTATLQSSTPFLQLVLGQNFPVTASSSGSLSSSNAVASAYNPVEVSMMVDLTGSMGSTVGGTTKIAALKSAGLSILDILLPDSGANDPYVRVAVAPFADYVNAGSYASAVTNLAATSTLSNASAYANATDLAKTGHGAFSGSYSGVISNQSGSQSGSTPAAANSGSGVVSTATGSSAGTPVTSGGGTYTSGYCATPTWSTAAVPATSYALVTTGGKALGIPITGISTSSTQPSAVAKASSSSTYYQLAQVALNQSYSGYYETLYYYGTSVNSGYYIPMLSIPSQGGGIMQNAGRDVGVAVPSDTVSSTFASSYFKYGTYWKATGTSSSGSFTFGSTATTGWYLPIYNSYGTPGTPASNGTYAGCENTNTASATTPPASLNLVSCVTERNKSGVLVYDDTTPNATNGWVGSYANKSSTVSNYSSNGKCNVAGRELAPVIPLTNSKSTLQDFFNGPNGNGPLIGGGTPGHLGTAWAWYLLSPNWNSIWNLTTAPAAYTGSTTKKYAILMTDGEYNEQYYSSETGLTLPLSSTGLTAGTSGEQALQLCQAMKNKGITVITIGFGYSINNGKYTAATTKDSNGKYHRTTDTAGTTLTIPSSSSSVTSETNAAYILSQCASPAAAGKHANYYFPYSQSDLADTFASIGLTTQPTPNTQYAGRLTQ